MERDAAEAFGGGLAVITGAGAGIGAGLARRAAALGMTVVAADIALDRAADVAALIEAQGGVAHAMKVDVARAEEMDSFAAEVHRRFGPVRLLINNAGIETVGFAWEIPADRWDATLDINIHGVVHGVRAFLPRMIASGEECWVANLSSVGGFGQMPIQTSYIMSKHAVQAFTECLALEVGLLDRDTPIHVCSVIPGMVRTRIFEATEADRGDVAVAHRTAMREAMAANGMDLDKACERIMDQMAQGKFWVSTQPRMTQMFVERRAAFLNAQAEPALAPELEPMFAHAR